MSSGPHISADSPAQYSTVPHHTPKRQYTSAICAPIPPRPRMQYTAQKHNTVFSKSHPSLQEFPSYNAHDLGAVQKRRAVGRSFTHGPKRLLAKFQPRERGRRKVGGPQVILVGPRCVLDSQSAGISRTVPHDTIQHIETTSDAQHNTVEYSTYSTAPTSNQSTVHHRILSTAQYSTLQHVALCSLAGGSSRPCRRACSGRRASPTVGELHC